MEEFKAINCEVNTSLQQEMHIQKVFASIKREAILTKRLYCSTAGRRLQRGQPLLTLGESL
jgi:hypothetical protein